MGGAESFESIMRWMGPGRRRKDAKRDGRSRMRITRGMKTRQRLHESNKLRRIFVEALAGAKNVAQVANAVSQANRRLRKRITCWIGQGRRRLRIRPSRMGGAENRWMGM